MSTSSQAGTVVSVQICPGMRKPMQPQDAARLLTNFGIEGDRHAKPDFKRQVLLIEQETLDRLDLSSGTLKENITTRDIGLMALAPGQRLRLGSEAIIELTGPCEPCERMEEIRAGLQATLVGQRGMLGRVITGGTIHPGDTITLI